MNRRILATSALIMLWLGALSMQSALAITLSNSQKQRIDAVFADYDTSTTPGCALGVMSEGRIIYARGYGLATLDPAVAIDSTKLFDIGSDSKQFTAGIIVRLAQQGKLKLTDDVRKYVPELPNYGTPITLNHLIWHTSGLRDYINLLGLAGYDDFEVTTQALALNFIKRQQKLDFPTGSRYQYSNSGYVLLAIVAERVTGKSFNTVARERFFNPLAMPLSVFRYRHDLPIPNLALGYALNDADGYDVSIGAWEQVGDGGLHTSIEEIQKWDENFFSGQVGGSAFVTEMYRRGKLNNGLQLSYARGLKITTYRGLQRVQHGGDGVGYHSQITRFPSVHTSFAVFCNAEEIDQYVFTTQVADIALENVFPQPAPVDPPPTPSLPLARFVGEYYSGLPEYVFDVTQDSGMLYFKYLYITLPLVATGPTTFKIEGFPRAKIEFLVQGSAPAHAVKLTLDVADSDTAPILGNRFTPVTPTNLQQYAGTFSSPELGGVSWKLVVVGGKLELKDNMEMVVPVAGPLDPAMTDAFFGGPGVLRFTRNATGQVTGFGMSYNGMRDIRFNKTP